jgi:hypothetical protein
MPRTRTEDAVALGITLVVAAALLVLLARHDLFLALIVGSVFAGLTYLVWRS